MSDQIENPSHYTDGKIEVLEFIEDKKLGFHLGNVVKYVCRAGKKTPDPLVDLKKAQFYLNRKIELLAAIEQSREPKRPNEMTARSLPNNMTHNFGVPVSPSVKEELLLRHEDHGKTLTPTTPCPFRVGESVAARISPHLPFFPTQVLKIRAGEDFYWITVADGQKQYELPEALIRKE